MKGIAMRVLSMCVAALVAALGGAGTAAGATYYVDAGNDAAKDENDGSEKAPWKTLGRATQAAAPGDVVKVRAGVYDEQVTVTRSGEKDKPVTFVAEPRRAAKMKGFTVRADYIRMEGFEITHGMTDAATSHGVHCGQGVEDNTRKGCQIVDNFIHDVDGTAIVAGAEALVKDNLLRQVGRGIVVNSGSLVENNEIDGLIVKEIEKNGKKQLRSTKYAFFYGDKITFRGNYFHGVPLDKVAQMGVCFFGSWDAWKFGPSHDILIENNRCFSGTHASEPIGEAAKQSSRITYRNNLFVNTIYVGVLCKQWSHITVVNNTFVNCGAYPVWFQTERECEGSVVRNNLIVYYKHAPPEGAPKAESGLANYAHPKVTLDCDYNLLWGCKNREYGKHDVTAEPQFVDPDQGDFRLKAGSPGVDAGTTVESVKTDLRGVARPQGKACDVGAYELEATPGK
jgi:hypothetical protein